MFFPVVSIHTGAVRALRVASAAALSSACPPSAANAAWIRLSRRVTATPNGRQRPPSRRSRRYSRRACRRWRCGDCDRYSYDAEKRIALETWARRLQAIIDQQQPGKLLPFDPCARYCLSKPDPQYFAVVPPPGRPAATAPPRKNGKRSCRPAPPRHRERSVMRNDLRAVRVREDARQLRAEEEHLRGVIHP